MKKILPLIALVILIATACKKDKNEPDPTPNSTPTSNIPQWLQDIDGKNIQSTNHSYRFFWRSSGVRCYSPGDTLVPMKTPIDLRSDSVYLGLNGKINVLRPNLISIEYINGGGSTILYYLLTNATANPDYFVFMSCGDTTNVNQYLTNTAVTNYTDQTKIKSFVFGQFEKIDQPIYDRQSFLFIPKNANDTIIYANYDQPSGFAGSDESIDWTKPLTFVDSSVVGEMNTVVNDALPYSFYANYNRYEYSLDSGPTGNYITAVFK